MKLMKDQVLIVNIFDRGPFLRTVKYVGNKYVIFKEQPESIIEKEKVSIEDILEDPCKFRGGRY